MNKKTILILGASSDIGLALIEQVHARYDKIIAHYHRSCEELLVLKERFGKKIIPIAGDFSDKKDMCRFIRDVETACQCPSHIIHMPAERFKLERFTDKRWTDLQREMNIELRSVYEVLQKFIMPMSKLGAGKIVFMLSSVTDSPPKYTADYTAVKFALLGLSKSLAAEYAGKVCINAVSPSMIETKFLKDIPGNAVLQNAQANPMKRNAYVSDVVPAIEFLLSDSANFITGQNLVVSGGSTL